jgi:hypothetical protein
MKRLILFILIFITIKTGAMASNADSALVEHTSLGRLTMMEAMRNPALHGADYHTSLSQLALGIDLERQSQAFVPEKGSGYTLPYLKVNTYHHLGERSTVWGEASYTTGKQHDIKWNSTSDYDLLQPYILADTLGGDTRRERYTISGGYAMRIHRWLLGAELLVRAEQEYRDHDPRMRGVVTDLTLRLGGGYAFGAYRLGAAVEGNIYKQTNSVAFYREEGVIPEYQMTGLGTEHSRFSGDKRSIYYDGGGVALWLHLSPAGLSGIYGDISLDEHRYHRKLAEYNSMPLTDLYDEHVGATIGWKREGDHRLATFGHLDYTRRTGNEHVGGTSDARYFPVIACLTMYKQRLFDTHAGVLYGADHWTATLNAGYRSSAEEYVYPHRQMDNSHAYGWLQGQCFLRPANQLLLTVDAHAAHFINTGKKLSMPFANMDTQFIQLIQHKHDYATANYTDLGAKVRCDLALKQTRYGFFAEVGCAVTLCSRGEHGTMLQSSIGITF